MEKEIINKIAQSALISIDMEEWYDATPRLYFDMKKLLFQELILREKDLRDYISTHNWEQYRGKHVAVFCSADAIVPTWAYMLLISKIAPIAQSVVCGTSEKLEEAIWDKILQNIDTSKYIDAKVVIKGCSQVHIPIYVYSKLTAMLVPVASSIMYGEPCSTVPVYKKPKNDVLNL
ncbi:MAG: DUF2480 family protein [Cytophagales bacterium]|nr:DUF2480 family protein [Cytophagales bacterium]